jgi:uncharacterized protein YcfL
LIRRNNAKVIRYKSLQTIVEVHCQQLIIQMNALIKNLSAEILKFNQNDFDNLRKAALSKYNELTNSES